MNGHGESAFGSLLLITVLAAIVPVLANRLGKLRIPIVVLEILAGIVIGKSGLDLVHSTPVLNFLAEFGFTFLMFLSGLEVDARVLVGGGRRSGGVSFIKTPAGLALGYFAVTVALAIGVGYSLTQAGMARNPVLMGLILSTTSLGIVVPILKERGLTSSGYGQSILAAALISDFVTLLLLSVTLAVVSQGLTLDLLLFLVLIAAFALTAKVGHWTRRIPMLPRLLDELSHATAQVRVRGALALLVVWVVLAGSLGVEVILGAFLAGAIVSISSPGGESPMREKLDAIGYGFFIPIFFINVGAQFDFGALSQSRTALALVPILILAAYAVKLIPTFVFRLRYSWRESLAAGLLLSSRLSLIIATAAVAVNLGIITAATNSAIILVAVVTCTLSPVLFGRLLPPQRETRRRGVVILGTDPLATLLGQRLRTSGEKVTYIGRDQEQLQRLRDAGFEGIFGSPEDAEVLARAGLQNTRALIALSNDPAIIARVAGTARGRFEVPHILARIDDPQTATDLRGLGIQIVQPQMAVALALEGALMFPAAFGMLMDKQDDVEIIDVPLRNAEIAGLPLRRFQLPGNALVLGVKRAGEMVVPHGDTVVQQDDILVLVGAHEALRDARALLAGDA